MTIFKETSFEKRERSLDTQLAQIKRYWSRLTEEEQKILIGKMVAFCIASGHHKPTVARDGIPPQFLADVGMAMRLAQDARDKLSTVIRAAQRDVIQLVPSDYSDSTTLRK